MQTVFLHWYSGNRVIYTASSMADSNGTILQGSTITRLAIGWLLLEGR